MSEHEDRIRELFDRADTLPYGPEERALLEEAIAVAEEAGDEELAYEARLRLTSSANMTGDTETMIASFGWTVGMHDRDPSRFPSRIGGDDLLFQYKWMASRLMAHPDFPLGEVDAVHADMAERYRAAGVGPSGVLQSRFFTAIQRGDLAAAARLREERELAPEDEYSHCDACVRNEDALFFELSGDHDRALAVYDEIIDGGLSCGAEPETSESEALLPYLRAGRLDDARRAHLRSYRAVRGRDDADNVGVIANHLVFCAVTGNEARGLAMLERHIGMLAADPLNLAGRLHALTAVAVLLDAVARAGHPDAIVRGADTPELEAVLGHHEGPWTTESLATVAWRRAEELADAFDARNGTAARRRALDGARALAAERYDVPVNSDSFQSRVHTGVGPARSTRADWLLAAREAMSVGALDEATAAAARAEALPEDGSLTALLGLRVQILLADEDADAEAVEELIAERVAALRAAGRASRADSEADLGVLLFGRGTAEDLPRLSDALAVAIDRRADDETVVDLRVSIAELELREGRVGPETVASLDAALDRADGTTEPRETRAVIGFLRAHALIALERIEDAVEQVDAILADVHLPRFLRLPALRLRMQLHLATGDPAAGLDDAEELMAITTAIGHRDALIDTSRVSAQLLAECGRPEEAAARVQFALAQLPPGEHALRLALLLDIGRYQEGLGSHEVAAETLEDAYRAAHDAAADASVVSEVLWWWGEAALGSGEAGLAANLWDGAIEVATTGDAPVQAAQAGISLGQLLFQMGQESSVDVLTAAADAAAQGENEQQRLAALHRRAQAKARFGDATALDDLAEVAAFARDNEAEWLIADVEDSRARALEALGRTDEAVPVALAAADRFLAVGDEGASAMAELFAARVLAGHDRGEEAVSVYRSVVDHLPRGTEAADGVGLEFGALLERLGRTDEAEQARRGGLDIESRD
ncbi:hypothetical protein [Mycetocola reblochoni]|uniref:Tetratricopeptide repeat protein n=2 Tax=Mycetocola reblochoni TaxID=331618 RepID=A0A1R4J124_9MICO|nr:hypothetical protein [Mycetocola reblochoni]RLP71212.1 hypothetical protein D9V30_02025 [Mycetocola reblochoni]SJN25792.1 hypothetical protein FM119_04780 [Mycetocola reblochoni REB411]